jgi:hypothetical protein
MAEHATNSGPSHHDGQQHELTLYVANDAETRDELAERIRAVCERVLRPGTWAFRVINISQKPQLARDHQIVALPLLTIRSGNHLRRLIGRLLDPHRLAELLQFQEDCYRLTHKATSMMQQAADMAAQAEEMRREARRMLESDPDRRRKSQDDASR